MRIVSGSPISSRAARQGRAAGQLLEIGVGRVGEQKQRQRELGEDAEGVEIDLDVEDPDAMGAERQPDGRVGDRAAHDGLVEPVGDEAVAEDDQGQYPNDIIHFEPLPHAAPAIGRRSSL